MFIGAVFLFAFGVTMLSLLGYLAEPSDFLDFDNVPVNRLVSELSPWLIASAGLSALIPSFFILMLGISLMVKRKLINRFVVGGLAGLFFVSAIVAGALLIPKINAFKKEGMVVKTMEFLPAGKILSLQIKQQCKSDDDNIFPHSL
jgi:hypothetical protein